MVAMENSSESIAMESGKDPDFASMKDSIELRLGNYFILLSLIFFQFINWILKSHGPPKSVKDEEWKWRNLWVSWLHALVASTWVVTGFIQFPEILADVILHVNYWTFFCACFSAGYFWYDFFDILMNNKARAMWEVVVHHVMVGGMLYYNVYLKAQIGFSMIALSVEVNSVFLHWRKLYQMTQVPFHCLRYRVIKWLNLVSFFLFRIIPLGYITIGLVTMRHRVPPVYHFFITVTMICMDILNLVLFYRLIKSDVLRDWIKGNGTTAKHAGEKNGDAAHMLMKNNHHSNIGMNDGRIKGNNNGVESKIPLIKKEA